MSIKTPCKIAVYMSTHHFPPESFRPVRRICEVPNRIVGFYGSLNPGCDLKESIHFEIEEVECQSQRWACRVLNFPVLRKKKRGARKGAGKGASRHHTNAAYHPIWGCRCIIAQTLQIIPKEPHMEREFLYEYRLSPPKKKPLLRYACTALP